jgi:hypothetical protein
LASARQTSDWRARAYLLDMAQNWIDLAELSEHSAWTDALRLRAMQAAIGRELRNHYNVSLDLPHPMLAILMRLNAEQGSKGKDCAFG